MDCQVNKKTDTIIQVVDTSIDKNIKRSSNLNYKFKIFSKISLKKYTKYRKASSRGAYGHDPFLSVFEEHRLDSTTKILQRHYL